VGTFSVRGGPHEGAERAGAGSRLQDEARRAGARSFTHDADNVYAFVIDAPSTPHAFIAVTDVFRPVYGDLWWADVSANHRPGHDTMDETDWDARHADDARRRGGEPSAFVVSEAATLPPGRALDLACGQGRHAVWLAEHGWQVTAVDFSTVGLEKARAFAERHGVTCDWVAADLLRYEPRRDAYDLVLLSYLHVPALERRTILDMAAQAIAPGGTFLLIGHDRSNLEHGYGGPHNPAVLYTGPEIVADLPGLVVERAERVERPVQTPEGERIALDILVRATRPTRP
jgi:SAM-dependent methyltransferase